MPFASWCVLRADIVRRELTQMLYDYERAQIVYEHSFGWWARYHDREAA